MSMSHILAAAALGLVAGSLIGCIGVGGVIIVPILVQIGGLPVHAAISISMAGYILTGLVGTLVYLRKGTLDWNLARFLCLGAMPAAIAGSLIARVTPSLVLELVIALLTATSGLQTLLRRAPAFHVRERLSTRHGLALGGAVGFVSSLTGTGGPAVLIPLLLWLNVPVLTTMGLAQAIQLPIAVLATIGNATSDVMDPSLSAALGVGLSVGAGLGARVAHGMNQRWLRCFVAVMLLGVGLSLLVRIAVRLV